MSVKTSPRLNIAEPERKVLNAENETTTSATNLNQVPISNPSTCTKSNKAALEVSRDLQKLMLRMKGEVMNDDGSGVNYDKLKKNELLNVYKEQASSLRQLDLHALSEDERTAFFINIYNALTIHGLVECEKLPNSVLDVQLFWKTTAYNIGGLVFSLDDIEHGVLRGNKPHPSSKENPFKDSDPRKKLSMRKIDPRIHFALVCGAKSCPRIRVYSAENLNKELDLATKSFCSQEVKAYSVQKRIALSRIFEWYGNDFGANDVEVIRWTIPYLDTEKQGDVELLLFELDRRGMVDIEYRTYDWNLNKI